MCKKISPGLIISVFIVFIFFPLTVLADYPWPKREKGDSLGLDFHGFYFLQKKRMSFFPGVDLSYHHSTINIDLGYQYEVFEKQSYFRISELDLHFPLPLENLHLFVGVKDHLWSHADKYWNYGLWQPRYLIDPLRPKQMGQPGIYLNYKGDSSLLFYFSFLVFPDFTVQHRLSGGKPLSRSPFFVVPFMTEEDQVSEKFVWAVDDLKRFGLSDILKPVGGFQIKHKLPSSELSLSYSYKTANQLHYSILMKVSEEFRSSDEEKIDLSGLPPLPSLKSPASEKKREQKPKSSLFQIKDMEYSLNYHHLTTLELEMFPSSYVSLMGSVIYENPSPVPLKEDLGWISEDRESHVTTSVLLQLKETTSDRHKVFFTLGYSNVFEIEKKTTNTSVILKDFESFFSGGMDWKNAIATSVEYKTKALFYGYDFNIRLNYALDNKLYLINFENLVFIYPKFQVYLSGDLFLRFSKRTFLLSSSHIIRYKDLSRIILGAKYVF